VPAALRDLDEAYAAWTPWFTEAVRETVRTVRPMHERRPPLDPSRCARPTLPASTARRLAILREIEAERIWIEDDVDGLSVLLAARGRVEVREPDGPHREWLRDEAARAGVESRLVLTAAEPDTGAFDAALIVAGPHGRLESSFRASITAVASGGAVVVGVRYPWESAVHELVRRVGLRTRRYEREVDQVVLAGRVVLEGAGDLLVLDHPARPVEVPDPAGEDTGIASVAVELHSLHAASLERRDLGDLQKRLGGAASRRLESEGCELLVWYGHDGSGMTAELVPAERRLWMGFMPYDPALEGRALVAAAELFGGDIVRTRPRPTTRTPETRLFALGPIEGDDTRLRAVRDLLPDDRSGSGTEVEIGKHRPADGLVIVVAPLGPRVVDLVHGDEIELTPEHLDVLDRLASGRVPEEQAAEVSRLVETGVLARDAGGVDAVLAHSLARLDAAFLDPGRLPDRARLAHERLLDAHARRRRLAVDVGQCPALPETGLRRALAVGDAEDVRPRDVLCLGDDDMVSVALATLGHRVTVIDLDEHLLALLDRASSEHDLALRPIDHDLRDPLEASWRDSFDVVLTDPVSSRGSLELFLSRGLSMLRPDGTLHAAVFPPMTACFVEIAREMGLPVEAWFARFNRYYSHRVRLHGYESDWVRARKMPGTRETLAVDESGASLDLYDEDIHWRRPSYTGRIEIDETAEVRPLFLDLLLDVLERSLELEVLDRFTNAGDGWSSHALVAEEACVVLHADRRRGRLRYSVHPHVDRVNFVLRLLLRRACPSPGG
jgi:hypothetical protein